MNRLTPPLYFILALNYMCEEVHFSTFNQTIPYPGIEFYVKADDSINITAQYNRNLSSFEFSLYALDQSPTQIISSKTLQNRSSYSFKKKFISDQFCRIIFDSSSDPSNAPLFLKITVRINNVIIRQHYSIVPKHVSKYNLEFTVDNPCRIKFTNASASSLRTFNFGLYSPNNQKASVLQTTIQNIKYFEVQLNISGKWNFQFYLQNIDEFYWKIQNLILNISTFTQSRCTNYCSQKQYPVVGKAPAVQNICVCDSSLPRLIWDKSSEQCIQSSQSVCNNGIQQQGQECDSNGEPGCLNCKIQPNYVCQKDSSGLSICKLISNSSIITPGVLAGIAVGQAVFFILLIFAIVYYLKVYKKKSDQKEVGEKIKENKAQNPNFKDEKLRSKKREVSQTLKPSKDPGEIKKTKKKSNMLQSSKKRKINPLLPCCICLTTKCQTILACSHYFHKECILLWFQKNRQCPLCQKNYRQSARSILQLKSDIQDI